MIDGQTITAIDGAEPGSVRITATYLGQTADVEAMVVRRYLDILPPRVIRAPGQTQVFTMVATSEDGTSERIVEGAPLQAVPPDSVLVSGNRITVNPTARLGQTVRITAEHEGNTASAFLMIGDIRELSPEPTTAIRERGRSVTYSATIFDGLEAQDVSDQVTLSAEPPDAVTVDGLTVTVNDIVPPGDVTITLSTGRETAQALLIVPPVLRRLEATPPDAYLFPGESATFDFLFTDEVGSQTSANDQVQGIQAGKHRQVAHLHLPEMWTEV